MSLGKRHIGRRVAGIGVAVALMMLGLAAPAFAAPRSSRRSRRPVARRTASWWSRERASRLPDGRSRVTFDGPAQRDLADAHGCRPRLGHRDSGPTVPGAGGRVPATPSVSTNTAGPTPAGEPFLATTGREGLRADHHLVHADVWVAGTTWSDHRDEPARGDRPHCAQSGEATCASRAVHPGGDDAAAHRPDMSTADSRDQVIVPSNAADGPIKVHRRTRGYGECSAPQPS